MQTKGCRPAARPRNRIVDYTAGALVRRMLDAENRETHSGKHKSNTKKTV